MAVSELLGKTLKEVNVDADKTRVEFVTDSGDKYAMYHTQDCCESVSIEDIVGEMSDLVGSPILQADESQSGTRPEDLPKEKYTPESETWTFYRLATIKGSVVIRWCGTSNGYYSESVYCEKA